MSSGCSDPADAGHPDTTQAQTANAAPNCGHRHQLGRCLGVYAPKAGFLSVLCDKEDNAPTGVPRCPGLFHDHEVDR